MKKKRNKGESEKEKNGREGVAEGTERKGKRKKKL